MQIVRVSLRWYSPIGVYQRPMTLPIGGVDCAAVGVQMMLMKSRVRGETETQFRKLRGKVPVIASLPEVGAIPGAAPRVSAARHDLKLTRPLTAEDEILLNELWSQIGPSEGIDFSLEENRNPTYNYTPMGITAVIKPAADLVGLSVAEFLEAVHRYKAAKVETTERETTGRGTAEPRPPETAPVAEREPPRPAQQRTAQELFGISASTPARRYHKSDGPEFCEAELADRVLLAAAEATRNEMKTRAKTEVLTTEERARWQRAGRFVYHARK